MNHQVKLLHLGLYKWALYQALIITYMMIIISGKGSFIIPKHLVDFLTYFTATTHIRITKLYMK